MPLNLSTLQQICARRFGYKAKETLDIMQGLYETHKLLTYPRTDNRYLSDEHFTQAGDIADAIGATLPELATATAGMDKTQKHKAFNASKIEAHHAIIPTTKSGKGVQLNEGSPQNSEKSYAKVFRASVRAETSRLPVCGSAARRNRRLG